MQRHQKVLQLASQVTLCIHQWFLTLFNVWAPLLWFFVIIRIFRRIYIRWGSRWIHDFHFWYVYFLTLLLDVFVLQLGNLYGIDVFGWCVDCEQFVWVQKVNADGNFVFKMHFSWRGKVFVDLGEKVKVFIDSCHE